MKFLIIYGHPDAEGFSSYSLQAIKDVLSQKNANFEIIDLYLINYDPVLKLEELYTVGNKNISPETAQFQQKIKESDIIIFIYPLWWAGMPAIMKGFMDRIFTPGFAFKYRKDKFLKFIPDKLLDDKKFIAITSSGGPKFVYKLLLDPIKLINKFIIFGIFCSKIKTHQFYKAGRLDEKRKKEINKVIKKLLK